MLDNSNILLTVWDGDTLVGFLRAMTDYGFDCYLNDLAVDKAYQNQGIGRTLLQELRHHLGDEVMILLSSAKDAVDFYRRNNFTEAKNCLWILNKK